MALINCPECGKEISNKAPACIHCGLPLNEYVQETEEQTLENTMNIDREINKVVEQFEDYRIREAAYYYQTSKDTYDWLFSEDVSIDLVKQSINNNNTKPGEYEAIDFVVENTKKIEKACTNPKQFSYYENYVITVGNLMKDWRYGFFGYGCWTFFLKNLNYNKLQKESIIELAKIIAKGNFTYWTKGELNVLFSMLTYSEKAKCMEYWGEKYTSKIENEFKVNSEALYNRWLECKNCGKEFDVNDIERYKETNIGNIILPEVSIKKESAQNVPKCPTCQSTNIKKISEMSKIGSVAMWGIFSRKVHKQWHCNNCGSEW